MDTITKHIQIILFLGALWGIFEATAGHVLHLLPYGISGMIMFPIGFYFMYYAYLHTGHERAIIMTGFIAGTIKLTGFLLPTKTPMSVLNPAMAIVLESLIVFGFIKIFRTKAKLVETIGLGFAWIIAFTLMQGILIKPDDGLYMQPVLFLLAALCISAIISGSIIYLFLKKQDFAPFKPSLSKQTYAVPVITLQTAVILEIVTSMIF
ncbi:MAG: hypothetical protein JXQ65_01310 [Candidatus Marinimicrobia bacterium]|nr:hypothetical protein [Candidatus Neomarinimicrobiota bacterium]